jgi:anti-anti-sigma factor
VWRRGSSDGARTDGGRKSIAVNSTERPGTGVALYLKGELDLDNADLMAAEFEQAIAGRHGQVYLDLSECTFIDSSGLQVVMSAARRLWDGGGTLRICGARGRVLHVFRFTALDKSPLFSFQDGGPFD